MPEDKTGNVQNNFSTPFSQLPTVVGSKTFDDYVLIGKKGDDISIWSNGNQEGTSDLLDSYKSQSKTSEHTS